METKKNPNADLEKHRNLILGFSFIISLSLIITAFEWKSYGDYMVDLGGPATNTFDELMEVLPEKKLEPPKPVEIVPKLIEVKDDEKIDKEVTIDIDPDISKELPPITFKIAPEPEEKEPDYFDVVESPAEPEGGLVAFYKYVSKNIKYPPQARRMAVEGKVFVQFVINKDGTLTDIRVIKGIGAGCDEEAVKVIESAPRWKPGKQRGVPVRQRMVLPITFKLG